MYFEDVFPVITVALVYGRAAERSLSVKKTELTFSAPKASAALDQSFGPSLRARTFLHRVFTVERHFPDGFPRSRLPTSHAPGYQTGLMLCCAAVQRSVWVGSKATTRRLRLRGSRHCLFKGDGAKRRRLEEHRVFIIPVRKEPVEI